MKMQTTNIKGQDYKVKFVKGTFIMDNEIVDGTCDFNKKIITLNSLLDKNDLQRVCAHELIHAMLYECGLSNYANDEIIVDWFARQLNEIVETLGFWEKV